MKGEAGKDKGKSILVIEEEKSIRDLLSREKY